MSSKQTKSEETPKESKKAKKVARQGIPINGICGLAILFVCASITYANYRVFFGTTNVVDKFMLLPSTAFVVIYLVYKSLK